MGGACVAASEFSSDMNPSLLVTSRDSFKIALSPSFGLLDFKKGPDAKIYTGSVATNLFGGIAQLSYTGAKSKTFSENIFDEFGEYTEGMKFDVKSIRLQYAHKAGENIFLKGDELDLGVGYSNTKNRFTVDDLAPGYGWIGSLASVTRSYSFTGGVFYRVSKKINFGASYTFSKDKITEKSEAEDFSENEKYSEETHQVRVGTSVKVTESTLVSFDYQHLSIGDVKKDQYFAGVEQCLAEWFCLYGGWANSGWTGGIGIYGETYGLNLAYMDNVAREIEPYFGKARYYGATAYWNF